jgi:hypothetical protein
MALLGKSVLVFRISYILFFLKLRFLCNFTKISPELENKKICSQIRPLKYNVIKLIKIYDNTVSSEIYNCNLTSLHRLLEFF